MKDCVDVKNGGNSGLVGNTLGVCTVVAAYSAGILARLVAATVNLPEADVAVWARGTDAGTAGIVPFAASESSGGRADRVGAVSRPDDQGIATGLNPSVRCLPSAPLPNRIDGSQTARAIVTNEAGRRSSGTENSRALRVRTFLSPRDTAVMTNLFTGTEKLPETLLTGSVVGVKAASTVILGLAASSTGHQDTFSGGTLSIRTRVTRHADISAVFKAQVGNLPEASLPGPALGTETAATGGLLSTAGRAERVRTTGSVGTNITAGRKPDVGSLPKAFAGGGSLCVDTYVAVVDS